MNLPAQDITEILSTTRSVRKRIDFERAIDEQTLIDCINVACQAPTGVGDEPWRFLVITEQQVKEKIAVLYRRAFDEFLAMYAAENEAQGETPQTFSPNYRFLADNIAQFPALILVCREGRPSEEIWRQIAFYGSVLPAAWSLMISLRAAKIGSTWTTLVSKFEDQCREALEIPADVTPTILLPIGYMKDAVLRPADRKDAREVTFFNRWN